MKAAYTRSKKILSRFIKVWFRGFPDIVTAEHLANMDIPPINDTRSPVLEPDNQVEACSKCRRHFELGVCAWRKLHTINTWSFGVTKTPRQCA
jgi:hypothetical protein